MTPTPILEYRHFRLPSPQYRAECSLREQVLRRPLNMQLRDEDIAGEEIQEHFVALDAERVVGCVLLQPLSGDRMKIRQLAVDEACRRTGIGSRLVLEAVNWAAEKGTLSLIAHVREYAAGFWRSVEFQDTGARFTEVGLPHLKMVRELQNG